MCSRYRTLIHAASLVVAVTVPAAAQQAPPIHGVTGTVATEGTIDETQKAGHTIFGKAAQGLGKVFHRNHPAEPVSAADEETLRGFKQGTAVVVHFSKTGGNPSPEELERLSADGLTRMEGVVTAVNRVDRTISVKLADGTKQTLRFSDQAAADVDRAGDGTGNVILYFKDEAGERVAHYFKRVP